MSRNPVIPSVMPSSEPLRTISLSVLYEFGLQNGNQQRINNVIIIYFFIPQQMDLLIPFSLNVAAMGA
jgi:hypothetical protein